ncbi:MAG TPA: hypothetical protein VM889_14050 [Candidatus Thermoplasmatota archaeon]|nr:hypothetical protein [Candidatus Thermoplasmatota archaeon]
MRIAVVLALVMLVPAAAGHATVSASDLALNVGWSQEPPVARAPNGIEVVVRAGYDAANASALAGSVLYKGALVANLTFAESSPGRFEAMFAPPHSGHYVVLLDGAVSGRSVTASVALPERAHDPLPARSEGTGLPANLPLEAILVVLALVGAALVVARRR